MHELPITQSLLEIALRHAPKKPDVRIIQLNIAIGELASIVDDSVQFYWDIIAKDTPAEGARLNFRRIPTELLCLDCDFRYTPGADRMECPLCDGTHIKIIAGEEFFLESIEVDRTKTVSDGG